MASDTDKPPAGDDPDFSDVQSGSSSTAISTEDAATPLSSAKTYTVVAGDSLSKIAQHQYGSANEWRKIYEANQDTIKNPDVIHPGQTLIIPD